jgi:general secretion pathway protein K
VRRAPSTRSAKAGRVSARVQRGVALLMVLVGLAVLGLVANELRYETTVELRLATNMRDDTRAYFLARSSIGMSRLMLRFQKQMDAVQMPNLQGLLGQLAGGNPAIAGLLGGQPQGAAGAQPSTMSIQLWRMAKIDCHMLSGLVARDDGKSKGGIGPSSKKFAFDDEHPELAAEMKQTNFGGFKGCFNAQLSDEEEKINLNKLDQLQLAAQIILTQMVTTLADKKYDFLYEREDSNRVKVTPQEIIANLRDWVDEDEVGTQLNFTGQGEPFQKGFSDENGPYSRYDARYQAKNARFDSLDEAFMVHGVNDKFMAAFRDRFTVYPDINRRLNINTDDPVLMELAIRSVADPARPDPRLADPLFIDAIIKKIRAAKMMSIFGMSASDFVAVVASAGVATNPTITNNIQQQGFIGDKSNTFMIKATGEAGDVTRTITAVVRLDDGLGRFLYWRED